MTRPHRGDPRARPVASIVVVLLALQAIHSSVTRRGLTRTMRYLRRPEYPVGGAESVGWYVTHPRRVR